MERSWPRICSDYSQLQRIEGCDLIASTRTRRVSMLAKRVEVSTRLRQKLSLLRLVAFELGLVHVCRDAPLARDQLAQSAWIKHRLRSYTETPDQNRAAASHALCDLEDAQPAV